MALMRFCSYTCTSLHLHVHNMKLFSSTVVVQILVVMAAAEVVAVGKTIAEMNLPMRILHHSYLTVVAVSFDYDDNVDDCDDDYDSDYCDVDDDDNCDDDDDCGNDGGDDNHSVDDEMKELYL